MKTVVCGLGKCGTRMVLDLNALIYGGKYSCQLRGPNSSRNDKGVFERFLDMFKSKPVLLSETLPDEEVPSMHMGDSDGQNEVVAMCTADSGDPKDEERLKRLLEGLIRFDNYHDACGQYHIIGEAVMRNLFATNNKIKPQIIESYIRQNDVNNVSAYFIMFSAGGGTGCGTATILAEKIAQTANDENHNMLIAGIAALPGEKESDNYKISAGRFITKLLSAERSTSFDAVFTVSNTIMEGIENDQMEVQTEANMFAAHLVFSLINSSSKYNRSSVEMDGPELRKNIHGLAYFCFAQQMMQGATTSLPGLQLLQTALSPVSASDKFDQKNPNPLSFEGVSISFLEEDTFDMDSWTEMLDKIGEFRKFVESGGEKGDRYNRASLQGDTKAMKAKLDELFDDPRAQLPLAMRSCKNVVILRGVGEGSKSSQGEQTCMQTLVEALFPKARVHYYATYHRMKEDTLTIIPSDYLSGEIVDMIIAYLSNVWEREVEADEIVDMLIGTSEKINEQDIEATFGDREMFERHFPDFERMRTNTARRFGEDENSWEDKYVKAAHVADMMNNVHEIVANTKREKKKIKKRSPISI